MTSQEYEIQHFEFSAEQISLERQYDLRVIVRSLLKPVLEKLATSENTVAKLSREQPKIVQKIQESFKGKMLEVEELDRKNFTIPENVLLVKDFDLTKNYKADDEERLDKEIDHLEQLFLENSIMIAALTMENSQYESVKTLLQEEVAVHSQIQESLNAVDLKKIVDLVANSNKFPNL